MDYVFFGLIALCVTAIAIVAMILGFCYKQEKSVSLKGKGLLDKDGFISELAVDIDTDKVKKKDKKGTNR